jgi:hypothetical protein
MRKAMAFVIAMTVGAGVAMADGAAAPAATAKPAKKEASKKPKMTKVMGVVTAVDAAGGKLSIKTKKGEMKDFTVTADVKVMKGKTKAALADVMVNDEVTVATETTGDVVTVKSITIKAPKAAAKK